MKPKTVASYLLTRLHRHGVKQLFLVPGAHLDPLIRELANFPEIQAVLCSHEVCAGYLADGASRVSGRPGVVAVLGGPGVSHLMTAVLTAATENRPLLILSGDVPLQWAEWPAFHNAGPAYLNQSAWLNPLLRQSWRLEVAQDLPDILSQALGALSGDTPGPVHVQIPANLWDQHLLASEVEPSSSVHDFGPEGDPDSDLEPEQIRQLLQFMLDFMLDSKQLACYVGSGLDPSRAAPALRQLAESLQIPVATTLCAKGLLPENHALSLGVFGFAGQKKAEKVLLSESTEALLVLGVNPNERNTLAWHPAFLNPSRKIIWVNQHCPDVILRHFPQLTFVQAKPTRVLQALVSQIALPSFPGVPGTGHLQRKQSWASLAELGSDRLPDKPPINREAAKVASVLQALRQSLPAQTAIFVDAGLVKLFAGDYWQALVPGTFHVSAEVGAMGWAIGAGIGAAFTGRPVVVLTGDGSMRMQGTEISTAAQHALPILFVLFNNGTLGSVAQRLAEHPGALDTLQLPATNWPLFAQSLGVPAFELKSLPQLTAFLSDPSAFQGPALIEVRSALPSDQQARSLALPAVKDL